MGTACCSGVFMAIVIMVGCSFDTLSPLEAGVEFNSISKQITEGRAYTAGRYWLGLGREFLVFPMDFQMIEFSNEPNADEPPLVARTDNVQIELECSLQYTLKLDKLTTLFKTHQFNYHNRFVKIALSVIKNTAVLFEPAAFYESRDEVSLALERALRAALFRENAIVHDFQLRKVTLPSQNEAVIIRKSVSIQEQDTAQHLLTRDFINSERLVVGVEQDELARVFQANKTSEATIIRESAKATGKGIELDSQSDAFKVLKERLGLDSDQLLRYLWLRSLRDIKGTKVAVGFDSATMSG